MFLRIFSSCVLVYLLSKNVALESYSYSFDNDKCLELDAYKSNANDKSTQLWTDLVSAVCEIFAIQNEFKSNDFTDLSNTVVILFHDTTSQAAAMFEKFILLQKPWTQFIYLDVEDISHFTLKNLRGHSGIHNVVLFSNNDKAIIDILALVSNDKEYSWTHLLHTVEWTVVSTSCSIVEKLQARRIKMDFVTVLVTSSGNYVSVFQKSRVEIFKHKLLMIHTGHRNQNAADSKKNRSSLWDKVLVGGDLRVTAYLYLKTQKSVLSHLHLTVAVLPTDEDGLAFKTQVGNTTFYDGFSVALLNVLACSFGFTYEFVWVDDGGFYGVVHEDGTASGITGQLARREAALTTLPFSWIENRHRAIDFVPAPITVDGVLNIIYRLPVDDENLDTTYTDIIKEQFILSLIGPLLLLAIISGLAHLATRSCTLAGPQTFGKTELRRLNTCPNHMCFQDPQKYASQTGRILRASWGVFCIILSSAYSAHLVTTFTVKPQELKIENFEQLLANPGYKFGMLGSFTSLINIMNTSRNPTLKAVWQKIAAFKEKERVLQVLSSNYTQQIHQVLQGGYAFIDSIDTVKMSKYVSADYTDVRFYQQKELRRFLTGYVGIPQDTFYKEDLYAELLDLEEKGILTKLKTLYGIVHSRTGNGASVSSHVNWGKVKDTKGVALIKIQLLIYVTLVGVGVGFVFLVGEICIWKFRCQ